MEKHENRELTFTRLNFPGISWRSDFWLAFIPFILSLVLLAMPDIYSFEWYREYGVLIAIILFILPLAIPILIWVGKALIVTVKRIHQFPLLFMEYVKVSNEMMEIRQNISGLFTRMSGQRVFEVSNASVNGNKIYILIPKVKGARLQEKDVIVVIDTNDGVTMGFFEVIQARKTDYVAEGKSGIDALWLGHVKEQGTVTILPYFAAVYVPQGGQND